MTHALTSASEPSGPGADPAPQPVVKLLAGVLAEVLTGMHPVQRDQIVGITARPAGDVIVVDLEWLSTAHEGEPKLEALLQVRIPSPPRGADAGPPAQVLEDQVGEVVYHGRRDANGVSTVVRETAAGVNLGPLRHIVRHSPTGMEWGFLGAGPADLARSVLLDALGREAGCPGCSPVGCGDHCDGFRAVPYQEFKAAVIGDLADEWRMNRAEVLAWLAERGITADQTGGRS